MIIKGFTISGQSNIVTKPLKQIVPENLFKPADLHADGGLSSMNTLGSQCKTAAVNDRHEGLEQCGVRGFAHAFDQYC